MTELRGPGWPLVIMWTLMFPVLADDLRAESPFLDLSLEEARNRAVQENKPIFIDFYTTWCGPCKLLEQQTWKDPKVIEWLARRTVPLKVDAEKEERLAARYKISAYPTLLFLKPDGTEIDRMSGFVDAAEFIAEGEGILSGKDALSRAREKMEAAGGNDPMTRMQYARTLADKGKSAEALREYLWCFDEGLKHSIGFTGVRVSFLLSDIKNLGQTYPPAISALRDRRDKAHDRVLKGKGGMQAVMDLSSLNETLDEWPKTLAIYEQLKKEHPKWQTVEYLRTMLFDKLREQHRYDELYDEQELRLKIETAIDNLRPGWLTKLFMAKIPKEHREESYRQRGRVFLQQLGACYEIMLGSGHTDEAAKLAARVIKADDKAETYNVLAWSGYLTGRPVQANLDQARKAYELSHGENAAIVDTYARLLAHFDRKSEARAILRQALDQVSNDDDRAILTKSLADLGFLHRLPYAVNWLQLGMAALVGVLLLALLRRRRRSHSRSERPPVAG